MRLPFRWTRLLAATVAASGLLSLPLFARADDGAGDDEQQEVAKKIREQMDKILRLMRDNEAKLLEAARQGTERPGAIDVKTPQPPEGKGGQAAGMDSGGMDSGGMDDSAMGESGSAGMDGAKGDGGTPVDTGRKAKAAIDELLDGVRKDGAKIPKELEELIRMIPT